MVEQNQSDNQNTEETSSGQETAPQRRGSRQRTGGQEGQQGSSRARSGGGQQPASGGRGRRQRGEQAAEEAPAPTKPLPVPRLLERLRNEIGPQMMQEFGFTSPMQIPRLEKIVLNIGLGESLTNARAMEAATHDLTMISGQRPVTTRAKKSIAGFKIRQGMPIGLSVTLRGRRMYEFLDRLISSVLPRIRDLQGVPRNSFDGRGNYSLGIREQVIFPEIDYNSIDRIRGLQISIVTTARSDAEGFRLLELFGMPFARTQESARVA